MFRKLVLAILLTLILVPAQAQQQQIQCPTRPVGDSSNACASTAFVKTVSTPVNPVWYGADPTGVNDSAPALTAALAVSSDIRFPAGTFKFLSQVSYTIPGAPHDLRISGAGQDNTILFSSGTHGLLSITYAGRSSNFQLLDMSITTDQVGGQIGVTLNIPNAVSNPANTAMTAINRVTFRGNDGYEVSEYWGTGIALQNVSNANIANTMFVGPSPSSPAAGLGVSVVGFPSGSSYAVVTNFYGDTFNNISVGISYQSYVQGMTVDGCNFTGNGGVGIQSPPGQSGQLAQLAVQHSQFNLATAIDTQTAVETIQVSNNYFLGQSGGTIMSLSANNDLLISNNSFNGGAGGTINGINIGASVAGSKGTITGNVFFSLGGTAITFGSGALNNNVVGNTFLSNGTNVTDSSGNATQFLTANIGVADTLPPGNLEFRVTGINFNSANTDTPVTLRMPPGITRYFVQGLRLSHASASISTATVGVFTGAGATGQTMAANQAITLTASAENTVNNGMTLAQTNAGTETYTSTTIFVRVGTPQGSAATADFTITIIPAS